MDRHALALFMGVCAVLLTSGAPQRSADVTDGMIPNPRLLRLAFRSHISLLADLYWIRMSSLATSANTPERGRRLIAWADMVTELDPSMPWPYLMGALLGVVQTSAGATENAKEAVDLLAKGTTALPGDPRLFTQLAYAQLFLTKDLGAAAQTLMRGSRVAGAPAYFESLATRVLVADGRYAAARAFASELAHAAEPMTRATFEFRLKQIDREELLDRLTRVVSQYRESTGSIPASFEPMMERGFLTEEPVDPLNGRLSISAEGRVVAEGGESLRLHLGANQ